MALILQRPPTTKPRDPESYEFNDEQLEKDYRKMWEKYQEMEAVLKENPEMDPSMANDYNKVLSETIEKDGKEGLYTWWKKT